MKGHFYWAYFLMTTTYTSVLTLFYIQLFLWNLEKQRYLGLLELFTLMIQTTGIHDPLPPHSRIKTVSHLDCKLSLNDSLCNFPLKLEESQQLVIHMHLKSNTPLWWPHLSWLTSEPTLLLYTSSFLSFQSALPTSSYIYMLPRLQCQGSPITVRLHKGSHLIILVALVNN